MLDSDVRCSSPDISVDAQQELTDDTVPLVMSSIVSHVLECLIQMSAAPLQIFQWMIHFSCPLFPWYFHDASRSLQDYLPAALKRKWNIHTLILNRSTLRKPFWWQVWSPDFAMRSATLAKTQLPNLAINGKRCLLPKTISNFFVFYLNNVA